MLIRIRMVRAYRVERFTHQLSVQRHPNMWSLVRSSRDFVEDEIEVLAWEGFEFLTMSIVGRTPNITYALNLIL